MRDVLFHFKSCQTLLPRNMLILVSFQKTMRAKCSADNHLSQCISLSLFLFKRQGNQYKKYMIQRFWYKHYSWNKYFTARLKLLLWFFLLWALQASMYVEKSFWCLISIFFFLLFFSKYYLKFFVYILMKDLKFWKLLILGNH